jgi:hypothetical protein
MQLEDRDGREWLVCPNGCATEFEAPPRKPPGSEVEAEANARAVAAGE